METFATRLTRLLATGNLTVYALAKASAYCWSFTRALQQGKNKPSLETACRIADALSDLLGRPVSLDELRPPPPGESPPGGATAKELLGLKLPPKKYPPGRTGRRPKFNMHRRYQP
jgi:transcriptional regulator with XRE-family HTH domain